MIQFGIGESAALATAVSWSISCLIHVEASSRLGATNMLVVRQPFALIALAIFAFLAGDSGTVPLYAGLLVFASGFFGVALCDWLFFHAVNCIGVRTAQVCQSSYVSLTAIMGVVFLGENIGLKGAFGIALATLGSILVIAAESQDSVVSQDKAVRRKGVLFAFVSAAFYALGLICSREALTRGVPPATAGFLRILAALIVLWSVQLYSRNLKSAFRGLKADPRSAWLIFAGCIFGTGGGMWLSMQAIANTQTAIATMLMGLQMVFVPILSWFIEHRKPNIRTCAGVALAFTGATIVLLK